MKRCVLAKTAPFHTMFIKKKEGPKRCRFDSTVDLLLPLNARGRGRRKFFFPLFSPTSPSKRRRLPFKKTPTQPTTFHMLQGRWRGDNTVHTGWAEPNLCIWARFRPAHWIGPDPVKLKKKLKFYFQNFVTFSYFAIRFLLNIGLYFILKKYESSIKIPGFRQNFQKYKKKRKKNVFVHTVKCLKTKKKIILCLSYKKKKNNVLACILL